ncbi:MAG: arylsulfatase [Opitutaceae bacterium]|nr:arylsulfatase [Opitutaceae bacterium]
MSRRLAVLWCLLLAAAAALSARQPNVIFILADDLGYGDIGPFGQKLIKTPSLDRMAAEGARYTQSYTGATVCAPSRCSLMTGFHNGHAAIRGNREIKPEGQQPMPADTFTVAHLFKQAGYATGATGKWGLGYPGSTSTPDKMGFDFFFGYNCQRLAHEYYPDHLWRNNQRVELDGKTYSHDLIAGEALDFIRRNRAQPFFLYAAFTIPHSKLQVPDLGPYGNEPWPENLKTIAAMITRLDRDVGRILDLVKELGIDDDTLVFFASDNGAVWRDELFHHSGALRGYKRDMYEGGIRSPTIARWPGHIAAGSTNDQVWAFWDFLPTMAELIGVKAPSGIDGISVLPALLGRRKIAHPPLYYEFHERGFHQAARIGDWKAVRFGTKEPIQLFDLPKDPSETTDVAAEHPEIVAQFDKFLHEARTDTPVWPVNEEPRGGQRPQKRATPPTK